MVVLQPQGLPVEVCLDEVRAALRDGGPGVAVLQAPPGAGKTTIVPLALLDEPWLERRSVVVLEPRRLATRAAATRMAQLVERGVGDLVGYRTRDERRTSRSTRVEVVTEGILTRRLQHDPRLPGVGLVVFDEFHERSIHADLGLALALATRRTHRPDLRILVMSATLDGDRVASLLGGAPVVSSEGRTHPVDVRWAPPGKGVRPADAAVAAVERALRVDDGDLLVFLPGAGDITRAVNGLTSRIASMPVDVRPLHGSLPAADQDAALAPAAHGRRRVVVATDIAETSLTVEGVRVIVDAGLARVPRFDPRTGMTRLTTVPASRASADQRAGRAGRTEPGVAYRLWSKVEHAARRPYADPEITSVDLAGLALELAVWGADVESLPFLDPPPPGALAEGRTLLRVLGAVDEDVRPTPVGEAMAELPLHPRLARMVVGAADSPAAWTACMLAALLEERDVLRGRPDDVPADVALRLELLADHRRSHPLADVRALRATRQRTEDVARRLGIEAGRVDVDAAGRLLAMAYPDRVGEPRGGAGRFRLRTGTAAWVGRTDPLATAPAVVAADLEGTRTEARIRMAAALDVRDIPRDERPAAAAAAPTRARVADLRWSADATALRARVDFVRRHAPDAVAGRTWPRLDDATIDAEHLDRWLPPGSSKRAAARFDVAAALRRLLSDEQRRALDRLAPTSVRLPSGRTAAVDYTADPPVVAVKVQELYGSTDTPAVAGGAVAVVLQLLSPAGRPVQITSDLARFWSGSWADVRRDLAGRYPKHDWPEDPATARPGRG